MATDIVPELLENIQRDFNTAISRNGKLQSIQAMIEKGTATYKQANEYAVEVGEILAQTFKVHIKSDVLPDGKMYYNIAERILNPTLSNNHIIVARVSAEIQGNLNRSVGLGLKGIAPAVNQFRVDSIINRVVAEEVFDDVAWILQEPIVNFTQSIVDDTIKTNVEFQGESGLSPRIMRSAHGHPPCDWCRSMEGVYKYPDVPEDVYKRHDRCRCTVEYDPGDVRRQNIWTKEWSG
ncbi:hypothetical protein CWR48_04245 [Oceanobacillus arenosus]|uniref:Phage head morphogenesis domain-containing protein n=1 Tax=Oceanobacillus arenosus TaxID=1229153 RepID=A0A3D8Q0T3_9BACI|nr:hypothetical protein [Oceanobacillus arenosus]RDW21029.1 hypothetical protein CWR48_04245 [Oceanobacillus arenosus]